MELWRYRSEPSGPPPGVVASAVGEGAAWREAMDRLCLPTETLDPAGAMAGEILSVRSPLGIEFARVRSQPQEISGRFPTQEPAVWLTVLLSGAGEVENEDGRVALEPGAVVYGPTGTPAAMRFATPFDQLFVKVPRAVLERRSIWPDITGVRLMPAGPGTETIFRSLLTATADALEHVSAEQLGAIDLSIIAFLHACATTANPASGDDRPAESAALGRLKDALEAMLGDPDLSLVGFAERQNVSPRHVQKLFAGVGDTFSDYLRRRRLELSRRDLGDESLGGESISSICFRYGFSTSAHFSHAFRREFGLSPRQHRTAER